MALSPSSRSTALGNSWHSTLSGRPARETETGGQRLSTLWRFVCSQRHVAALTCEPLENCCTSALSKRPARLHCRRGTVEQTPPATTHVHQATQLLEALPYHQPPAVYCLNSRHSCFKHQNQYPHLLSLRHMACHFSAWQAPCHQQPAMQELVRQATM
jgi:hypothetical protein